MLYYVVATVFIYISYCLDLGQWIRISKEICSAVYTSITLYLTMKNEGEEHIHHRIANYSHYCFNTLLGHTGILSRYTCACALHRANCDNI